MLFNSAEFIFGFLPIVLVLFFLSARISNTCAKFVLLGASVWFYGYWNVALVALLFASIAFNYIIGSMLRREHAADPQGTRSSLFLAAIATNLGVLFYFKYWNFFIETSRALSGVEWSAQNILLPLGISFFTFQQIIYLKDCRWSPLPHQKWSDYALFVTFFPHLIAGPLLHHRSMLTQFSRPETFRFDHTNLINGMAYFWLGLAKKVLIADYLAVFADQTFGGARDGMELGFVDAWIGMLAFSLQLYFDFSGYSDMAIGLALMFNIALPLNFNAPLRATSIIAFWRCWHMSLSAFLRDNVYIPLGGNRRGEVRRNVNVMATMLLGGVWHGAGWTFVLWGGLHGLFLTVNHAWRRLGLASRFGGSAATAALAWGLTFLAVTLAWVPFRADSVHHAVRIYRGAIGLNGMGLPESLGALLPGLGQLIGASTGAAVVGGGTVTGMMEAVAMLGLALAIVLCLPTLQRMTPNWRTWCLVPSFALALQKVAGSGAPSPFLYFQF